MDLCQTELWFRTDLSVTGVEKGIPNFVEKATDTMQPSIITSFANYPLDRLFFEVNSTFPDCMFEVYLLRIADLASLGVLNGRTMDQATYTALSDQDALVDCR